MLSSKRRFIHGLGESPLGYRSPEGSATRKRQEHLKTGGPMAGISISGKELRRVVIAASVGNIIEWYDFYIFGSLAAILAVKFFDKTHPVAAFLSTVAIFSVGFLIRPLGAFVFGYLGAEAFAEWGWRVPFIISLLLVAIAIYIRLSLQETPVFLDMKAKGQATTNPWREAFLSRNIKYIIIASIVVLGQGCVWYSGQFWALFFLQKVKNVDVLSSSYIIGVALLIATPTLIFWGWLSDKVGRKPIILGGMALAALTYYPLYSALGNYAEPTNLNYTMSILIVVILVNYVRMTYGPIGAFLAEFFPSRIRYTSVSVP